MNNIAITKESSSIWVQYLELCKPNVVSLIVFTAIVGMLLSTEGAIPVDLFIFGTIGIAMASAAGAAINHVIDQNIDMVMQRTMDRPIPTGAISEKNAIIFAALLAISSTLILTFLVNPLTALLTLLSMIGYAFIYTIYLKRTTPHNIVLGGAAGATPPLLGWCAITGTVTVEAVVLFLIIFIWTPPHFWPLAIKRRDEYRRAGLPMLPLTHGVAFTKQQILIYSFLLFAISLLPYSIGMSGIIYLVTAVTLGIGFIYYAVKLYRSEGDEYSMQTFGYSIFYLCFLFAALLSDHYLA